MDIEIAHISSRKQVVGDRRFVKADGHYSFIGKDASERQGSVRVDVIVLLSNRNVGYGHNHAVLFFNMRAFFGVKRSLKIVLGNSRRKRYKFQLLIGGVGHMYPLVGKIITVDNQFLIDFNYGFVDFLVNLKHLRASFPA